MTDNKNTAAQPLDLSKLPRVFGVSRDAESPGGKAVLVTFHRALTDDELRTFHDGLTAQARASQPAESITVEVAYDIKDAAGPGTQVIQANSVMRHADGHYTVFIDAPASEQQGASQPEGATGTTGASVKTWQERMNEDGLYAVGERLYAGWTAVTMARDAEIADLRAQLAAKGQGKPVAYMIRDKREYAGHPEWSKWHPCSVADYELRKAHTDIFEFQPLGLTAPASAQPDRGATQDGKTWLIMAPCEGGPLLPDSCSDCRREGGICDLAAASPASQPVAPEATHADGPYGAAYQGAREDLAIWKKRALEAEDSCRRLTAALNAENGPTFMGEPAIAAVAPSDARDATVPDHSERGTANAKVHGPKTLMTDEQAFNWAWTELKKDLGAERWNAGDEVQSWAFFKYGWDHRTQLELQRYKAPATIAAGQEAANAKDAARYRWLRAAYWDDITSLYWSPQVQHAGTPEDCMMKLDEAIDAAMAAAPSSEKGGADHG